ncbi:MAG: LysR family transcriptional regulator [Eubacteriaceae bacterium]|nr:LysR family transcriptional regulator [Eubacteriaceae bacterium]
MALNIRHIEFFMEICKEKSTARASKNLHISQQGLSKAIINLETQLDVTLFNRTTNGLELTEYGKQFYNHATNILNEYQLMEQQIRLIKDNKRTSLHVGYAEGIFYMLPKNFISQFMLDYPEINIVFRRYPDKDCETAVISKEVDMALTTAPLERKELKSLLNCKAKVYAVINRNSPLAAKKNLTVYDLKKERIITLNEDTKYSHTLDALTRYGIEPKLFINPSELAIQFDLCSANMAVGFFSGNPEHLPPNLTLKPIEEFDVSVEYSLVTLKETPVSEAMDSLTASIRQRIQEGLNWNSEEL